MDDDITYTDFINPEPTGPTIEIDTLAGMDNGPNRISNVLGEIPQQVQPNLQNFQDVLQPAVARTLQPVAGRMTLTSTRRSPVSNIFSEPDEDDDFWDDEVTIQPPAGSEHNQEDYIKFPNEGPYTSKRLTKSRDNFLDYIKETRTNKESYKKYLILTLTGKELYDLYHKNTSALIRKRIPEAVLKDIDAGKKVEAIVFVEYDFFNLIFKFGDSDRVLKVTRALRKSNTSDLDIKVMSGTVCAKLNITNIIKAEVDKNGEYSSRIEWMTKVNNTTVEKLKQYGKIKPIYSLNVSGLQIFPDTIDISIFMERFRVATIHGDPENASVFQLKPEKVLQHEFSNMGMAWA